MQIVHQPRRSATTSRLSRFAMLTVAILTLTWSTGLDAVAGTRASGAMYKYRSRPTSKYARLLSYPPKCLKRDGFGHIKRISPDRWQGTIGEEPRTKLNDSAFVVGPYASPRQASRAAARARRTQIAYAGGLFIVTARHASYLDQETSLAAACLASYTVPGGYTF